MRESRAQPRSASRVLQFIDTATGWAGHQIVHQVGDWISALRCIHLALREMTSLQVDVVGHPLTLQF